MPFNFKKIELEGVQVIIPKIFKDNRGFFLETYKESDFISAGIIEKFVQDNYSVSSFGTLRGLHFQKGKSAQGKLIRVIKGSIIDVIVDIKPESENYRKYYMIELNTLNRKMIYIPPGFAHGFLTKEDDTHICYKCTKEYDPDAECGIRWCDPDLNIQWPDITNGYILLSEKDSNLPYLKDI